MVWGAVAIYYLVSKQAIPLWKSGGINVVPALVYVFILCPMLTGSLGIFGWYALKGEFDD